MTLDLSLLSAAKGAVEAPSAVPELPEGLEPLPPPLCVTQASLLPVKKPRALASEGKPVPTARLVLEPELMTISLCGRIGST